MCFEINVDTCEHMVLRVRVREHSVEILQYPNNERKIRDGKGKHISIRSVTRCSGTTESLGGN
jgi:hypothetical protein